jgi:hypothetical protein
VEELKSLTLDKLHQTLIGFKVYKERVGDLLALARYVYSEGLDEFEPVTTDDDELRAMISEYVVCEIDTIGNTAEFMEYAEQGGQFMRDVWQALLKRGVL